MSSVTEESEPTERSSDTVDITIEDVRKTFDNGNIVACEDINLNISHDDFVVLLGPSGCGKTTTLRCIAGLGQPDSGAIYIGGDDVTKAKPKDRDLAFVFQSIALFPHMSVRENIQFGLNMKGDVSNEEKAKRVKDAAEILGIGDLLDRSPSELSGGQQQRVSLGRAMVMEPAAFLLDEPFSALDANLRDQLQTEVKQLQRQLDTAMIFVTHDQEEAMSLGDYIVVMNNGHIQQVASPHEIYNDPKNRFVASFIGSPSTNMLDCVVAERDGAIVLDGGFFTLHPMTEQTERLTNHVGRRLLSASDRSISTSTARILFSKQLSKSLSPRAQTTLSTSRPMNWHSGPQPIKVRLMVTRNASM